jgi:uncharacterized protein YjbI with pentapeptide repeats
MLTTNLPKIPYQKLNSGLKTRITLNKMQRAFNRFAEGVGSGIGDIRIHPTIQPKQAQTIVRQAHQLKNQQMELAQQTGRLTNTPRIHAPKANLTGLTLPEKSTILERANLKQAHLPTAQLAGTSLRGANFEEANLQAVSAYEANLTGAKLKAANLKGADMIKANLTQADLQGSDLSQARLSRGILHQTNFTDADLHQASLFRATVAEKRLKNAKNVETALLPEHFTPERSGYGYDVGQNNLGVKVGKRLVTKRLPPSSTELSHMQRIEERLGTLEKTNPDVAKELRSMLVNYRGTFIDPKNPEHHYVVMERAQGQPLSEALSHLTPSERSKVREAAQLRNDFFSHYLGFELLDRSSGNIFVHFNEQGRVKLGADGQPLIQHIDYGSVSWR